MMLEHVEREWKLVVPDVRTFRDLRNVPGPGRMRSGDWNRTVLDNHYFDSEARQLAARSGALRLRSADDGSRYLTLKHGHRREGAFHHMQEVECLVDEFDWRDPWAEPMPLPMCRLEELIGRVSLVPIARFQTERYQRRMEDRQAHGASMVLDRMMLDDGSVLLEMELELDGAADGEAWGEWVETVRRRFGLESSEMTKLARALSR